MIGSFFRPFMPGFRVRPPGFDVRPQDDVPGFNLDENGVPRREGTWSDGMSPGAAMSRGLTPVNCTTVNGTMNCTSPGGVSFGDNIKAPPGLPERLNPSVDDYHGYSVPDGPYSDSEQTLTQHIINHPTAGPARLVKPATPEGTLNDATPIPQWLYDYIVGNAAASGAVVPPDGLISPVRSYLRTDQNGRQIVVNVTEHGHGLNPGYVVRYTTPSSEGATIQNEGEGTGWLQGRLAQRTGLADWINDVWRGLYGEQTNKPRKQP
jgi:hypothetical protein